MSLHAAGNAGNNTQASAEDGFGPATPLLDAFHAHSPLQTSWPQQLPEVGPIYLCMPTLAKRFGLLSFQDLLFIPTSCNIARLVLQKRHALVHLLLLLAVQKKLSTVIICLFPTDCCSITRLVMQTRRAGLQGWEDVSSSELQICAACNLPWLDTTFKLAPQAQLNSG